MHGAAVPRASKGAKECAAGGVPGGGHGYWAGMGGPAQTGVPHPHAHAHTHPHEPKDMQEIYVPVGPGAVGLQFALPLPVMPIDIADHGGEFDGPGSVALVFVTEGDVKNGKYWEAWLQVRTS